jgi:hypothetical protein
VPGKKDPKYGTRFGSIWRLLIPGAISPVSISIYPSISLEDRMTADFYWVK